jgi:hypothetical protein
MSLSKMLPAACCLLPAAYTLRPLLLHSQAEENLQK